MRSYENEVGLVETLAAVIRREYGLPLSGEGYRRLAGGERNDVFLLQGDNCTRILRIQHHGADLDGMAYTHRWAAFCAQAMPVAVAPCTTPDGRSYVRSGEHILCVYPFVEGAHADCDDPTIRDHARRAVLYGAKPQMEALFRELRGQSDSLVWGPIHGDLYGANVLARCGRVIGVIDWDEANRDLHVYELARTMWEFAKDTHTHSLCRDRALRYLEVYRDCGGTSGEEEWRFLIPLIRAVKLLDIAFYLNNAMIGDVWSPAYGLESIKVLENLEQYPLF